MLLSEFNYQLPKELIAQTPLKTRSSCRLMVVDKKNGDISHRQFKDFPRYLASGDSLVLNDTKVFPARLFGRRATGAKVEVLILNNLGENKFNCLIKPSRIKLNESINFNNGSFSAKLIDRSIGKAVIEFSKGRDVDELISRFGVMPLPAYIKRQAQDFDWQSYQTVYAKNPGAVAAPTAGLHFDLDMLEKIKKDGVNIGFLTLHVGIGTFKPIRNEDVASHKMEEEEFELTQATADLINMTKKQGNKVFAVGTTSARVLESQGYKKDSLKAVRGKTNLYIYPGFKFKVIDGLLTNFHLPKSTLFLLICAFAGKELIFKAYQEAIKEKYRFYSYGDAMLIL